MSLDPVVEEASGAPSPQGAYPNLRQGSVGSLPERPELGTRVGVGLSVAADALLVVDLDLADVPGVDGVLLDVWM